MNRRAEAALHAGLVVACAGVVYANSLANGFAFDDVPIIAQNARVHQLTNLGLLWNRPYWPFFGSVFGLYRPLTTFLFAVQWWLFAGSPAGFHAVNLCLHAAVSVLILLYLRRFVSPTAALTGALVFVVHPLHTEVVANVVGQAELLAALGILVGCLVHSGRTGQAVSWGRQAALVLAFACALLAKESAVILPALLVASDVAQRRVRFNREGIAQYGRAMAVPLFLLLAVVVAYLAVRVGVLGSVRGSDAAPALPFLRGGHRLLMALRAWPEYARLLFFPLELVADYAPGVILPVDTLTPMVFLGAALLALTLVLAAQLPVRRALAMPAAWFLISVLPVSNLFFPVGVVVAERTLYVPSLAVALLAGWLWEWLAHAPGSRPQVTRTVAATLIALLGVRAWARNPVWRDTDTVLASLVRDHPESYRSQVWLAEKAWDAGDLARADEHWHLAHTLSPDAPEVNVGMASFDLTVSHDFGDAAVLLERAHAVQPQLRKPMDLLAYVYACLGRSAEAERLVRDGFRMDGPSRFRFIVLAAAYEGLGRPDVAAGARGAAQRRLDRYEWPEAASLARDLRPGGRCQRASGGRRVGAGEGER